MREVLFFGSLAATLVHYEASDAQLVRELEQQNAFLKLRVSASAAESTVRESFAAVSSSALVELRARARPAVELDGAQWRQRSLFCPLMLEQSGSPTITTISSAASHEEKKKDVGIVAELAVILSRSGCGSRTVLTKGISLPALNAQTACDECIVARLHVSAAELQGHIEASATTDEVDDVEAGKSAACDAAESPMRGSRRSSAARSSGSLEGVAAAVPAPQQPALELLVLLRVIDLSEKAAALLEADRQLRAELISDEEENNSKDKEGKCVVESTTSAAAFELASTLSLAQTARRAAPYGAMPLNDLYRHYRLFIGSGTGGKVLRHSDEVIRLLMEGSQHTERAELMAQQRWSGGSATGASLPPSHVTTNTTQDENNNKSSSNAAAVQPLFLYRWDSIEEVNLTRSLMGEHAFAPLLLTLAHCCNLRDIAVDRNGLGDLTAARLAALFTRHRALRRISLCGNRIHEGGASRLLRLVRRNTHLVQLCLADTWCSNGLRRRIEQQCEINAQHLAHDCCNLFGPQYDALCLAARTAAANREGTTNAGNTNDDSNGSGDEPPRLRLPAESAAALLQLWSTLTAAPIGDVDVWTRNSTTVDLDQYVDDNIEPRKRAAAEAAQALPSFIPACAYAPLLNEVMRTVARAVRRAVTNTRVFMLFTDMVASTAAQKAQLEFGSHMEGVGEETTTNKSKTESEVVKGNEKRVEPSASSSSTTTTVVVSMPAGLAETLQLNQSAQATLLHAAAEDRYRISFLRLVIVTVRALLDEIAWSSVVPVLRRIGEAQRACGVLPEDYVLAARSFLAAVEVCCGAEVCTKEAAAVLLNVLALAVRTATGYDASS